MRYIIDTQKFRGTILATMSDNMHTNGSQQTFEEYVQSTGSKSLRVVNEMEFNKFREEYIVSQYTPFSEITETEYYKLINSNPIKKYYMSKSFVFFYVGKFTALNCYRVVAEYKDKYYTAVKDINLTEDEIKYRLENLKTISIYDFESASHCMELHNYCSEHQIDDPIDLFDINPEIIKTDHTEIVFTHISFANHDIIIYLDTENTVGRQRLETILSRFLSDDFNYFFDPKFSVWSEFQNNCIAYRNGKSDKYSIWQYKF